MRYECIQSLCPDPVSEVGWDALLTQQLADGLFRFCVRSLTDMGKADGALLVQDEPGWPCINAIGVPGSKVIVERDGIRDLEISNCLFHIRRIVLKGEFGRVDADDDQPLVVIPGIPTLQIWDRVPAIDAIERPKVD